ncbi:MAG: 23S rRNA (guanosine(2251)-2'-O)-methyltransferase RlmB [Myxococcota bacterium]|nr:23S rRNA (guanosine(2251)-2'-O)-methyltransferase RlmB [Myxococcota bacterium]
MKNTNKVYGFQSVREALAAGNKIEVLYTARKRNRSTDTLITAAQKAGARVESRNRDELTKLAGTDRHQGVVAFLESSGDARLVSVEDLVQFADTLNEDPLILVLDQIQDPHNLGALLRTAYALGFHGAIIPDRRACQVTPAVVKVSAGAAIHLRIARVTNIKRALEKLKDRGVWCAAAVMNGEVAAKVNLRGPLALVVGSEGDGVRRTVAETCDYLVSVPMSANFDSLNASVAGGILMYETLRQRM